MDRINYPYPDPATGWNDLCEWNKSPVPMYIVNWACLKKRLLKTLHQLILCYMHNSIIHLNDMAAIVQSISSNSF